MAISADLVVRVTPQVIGVSGTALRPNGLLLTRSPLYPPLGVTQWTSADQVGAAYGETSLEYDLAAVYFKGYTGSTGKPRVLYIGTCAGPEALAPWVNGGAVTDPVAGLQVSGKMTLQIGGASKEVSVDLSGASSYSAMAQSLQQALNAEEEDAFKKAEVAYSSQTRSFRITAGVKGEGAAMAFPTGPVAEALHLTESAGGMLAAGCGPKTFAENMAAFLNINRNFVCFMTTWEPDTAGKLEIAKWTDARHPRFVYMAWDSDLKAKDASDTTNFGSLIREYGYEGTAPVYDNPRVAAFGLGIAACMNPLQASGRITFFGRPLSGLASTVDNDGDAVALAGDGDSFGNGYNFYGDYATANDSFRWFSRGTVSGGYKWLDTLICAILLNNDLQLAFMNMMQNQKTIPYNDEGYSILRNYAGDVIERYIRFGAIVAGISLAEEQKTVIINDCNGFNFIAEIERDGWYLYVPPATAAERVSRQYVNARLYYTDGGSIQQIDLSSATIL